MSTVTLPQTPFRRIGLIPVAGIVAQLPRPRRLRGMLSRSRAAVLEALRPVLLGVALALALWATVALVPGPLLALGVFAGLVAFAWDRGCARGRRIARDQRAQTAYWRGWAERYEAVLDSHDLSTDAQAEVQRVLSASVAEARARR